MKKSVEWAFALGIVTAATIVSAAVQTPAESKLFDRWVDPSSGVVSYLLKDDLTGKWDQQAFYFVTKSMSDDGSWDESSYSAMFAYGLNEGAREGWLDDPEGCRSAAMKCFRRLAGSLDGRGNVPGVCVGTGAKDDRQYYLDRARINGDPHG